LTEQNVLYFRTRITALRPKTVRQYANKGSTVYPTSQVCTTLLNILFMARQPLLGQGLLINESSRSYSDTPHSVGLLWTSDQPDAETSS